MVELDCTKSEKLTFDERVMRESVICEDAELYFLDCFLADIFAKKVEE